jgi:hypothetical protein
MQIWGYVTSYATCLYSCILRVYEILEFACINNHSIRLLLQLWSMLIDTHLVYQLTLYYYVAHSDFALIKDAKKEKDLR